MDPVEALADRVEALERANRRLTYALIFVGILAAAWTLSGLVLGPAAVVQARKFALVDREGREHAILEVTDGSPQLLLYDEGILPRLALFARPGGASGLALYDRVGARATLTASHDGGASLALQHDGQSSGGSITLLPAGDVAVRAWSEGGAVTIAAPVDKASRVEVQDGDGVLRGQLPTEDLPVGHKGWSGRRGPRPGLIVDRRDDSP
jgi:hypothetical protein